MERYGKTPNVFKRGEDDRVREQKIRAECAQICMRRANALVGDGAPGLLISFARGLAEALLQRCHHCMGVGQEPGNYLSSDVIPTCSVCLGSGVEDTRLPTITCGQCKYSSGDPDNAGYVSCTAPVPQWLQGLAFEDDTKVLEVNYEKHDMEHHCPLFIPRPELVAKDKGER